jgi:hypothetical protein
MIKLISTFIVLSIFSIFQDKSELTGKWVDEQKSVSYEFKSDGTIEFEQNGMSAVVTEYTLEAGNPMKAKLTMRQGPMSMTIPALIKIVDSETLWIEQFAPGQDPSEFSNRPHQIHVLKKVK